jgi:hypothetical protein
MFTNGKCGEGPKVLVGTSNGGQLWPPVPPAAAPGGRGAS